MLFYLHASIDVNSTDSKLAVFPLAIPEPVRVLWREGKHVGEAEHMRGWWGHLPGFKDLHLPDMCVPTILVIRQDADLKEKGFHWSKYIVEHFPQCLTQFFSYVPSLFVISMSTHSSGSSRSKALICFILLRIIPYYKI